MKRVMMGNWTLHATGLAVLATLTSIAGCSTWSPLVKETRVLRAEHFDVMAIDVKTRNGKITVERADVPDVQITATLKALSEQRLQGARIVADHDDRGVLMVRVEWPDGKRLSREGCSFEILTPGAYGVSLDSSNGALTIRGLEGEAVLDTSNGAVRVADHVGDVRADSSNGAITLERIDGAVYADTSNGRIRVIGVTGPVEVDTSNGAVTIELAEHSRGPIFADTSNGAVSLVVHETFEGELVLDTNNGRISIDAPSTVKHISSRRNHAVLRFSETGPKSVVSTSNGSITVRSGAGE